MIYNQRKPDPKALEPIHVIREKFQEQDKALYDGEKQKAVKEAVQTLRKIDEHSSYLRDYVYENDIRVADRRAAFLNEVKTGFMTAALYNILNESLNCHVTSSDKNLMKGLVENFVNEQGVGNLLTRFKYQNTTLAEIGRVIRESYSRVVDRINETAEGVKNIEKPDGTPNATTKDILKLDKDIVDKFYSDMADVDTGTATQMIRDKVSDSMNDFIDDVGKTSEDIREIIEKTKATAEKYAPAGDGQNGGMENESQPDKSNEPEEKEESETEPTDESTNPKSDTTAKELTAGAQKRGISASGTNSKDSSKSPIKEENEDEDKSSTEESTLDLIYRDGKRKIMEAQHARPKTPFRYLVEALTKETLRDPNLSSRYIHESKIDMDGIVHNAEIMYTMLEMVNTLEIVDQTYIKNYIESLVNFK